MANHVSAIEVGFQVFLEEGGDECGAVRDVLPGGRPEIVIYVENAGDFTVSAGAVCSVHDGKVVLAPSHLSQRMRDAIAHAHDREEPGT
jgi:hypothetical protein